MKAGVAPEVTGTIQLWFRVKRLHDHLFYFLWHFWYKFGRRGGSFINDITLEEQRFRFSKRRSASGEVVKNFSQGVNISSLFFRGVGHA